MENTMNIFEKLSKITTEITRVAKNLSVQAGKDKYKAVGEADVLEAVKPLEAQYRVYSYPSKREIVQTEIFKKETTYNGEKQEKTSLFMRLKTTYRFVNIDKPEEYVEIDTYGDGVDSQDKAPGKAMTYADKYALLKAYKIMTGDDPDQNGSTDMGTTKPSKPFVAPTLEQKKELEELGGTIDKVAGYFNVAQNKVSADMVQALIDKKKERLAKVEANVAAVVNDEEPTPFDTL